MQVELWAVEKVVPYARNPRKNGDAVAKVAASIKEFGFRQPIVVDAEGVVIVGHTRLEAARQLGITQVPVGSSASEAAAIGCSWALLSWARRSLALASGKFCFHCKSWFFERNTPSLWGTHWAFSTGLSLTRRLGGNGVEKIGEE